MSQVPPVSAPTPVISRMEAIEWEFKHLQEVKGRYEKALHEKTLFLNRLWAEAELFFTGGHNKNATDVLKFIHEEIGKEYRQLRPDGAPPNGSNTLSNMEHPHLEDEGHTARLAFPIFRPGNQCHEAAADEDSIRQNVEALKAHRGYRFLHERLPQGELAVDVRREKIERVADLWNADENGLIEAWLPPPAPVVRRTKWKQPAAGTPNEPQGTPPVSPITPPMSPLTPPPQAPAMAPATILPPAAAPAPAPRGRKRKAAEPLPPRQHHARAAKTNIRYT